MSDLTADQWGELQKLADGAARRVASSWPDAIEVEDLSQGILLRLVESPGAAEKVFEEDEPTRKAFFVKMAHQVASEQFQDYEQFSGNYTYDTATVRGLLDRQGLTLKETRFSAEIADLRAGLANLADSGSSYYAEVVNRYVHDIIPGDSTGRSRLLRAVESLTAQMNRIGAARRKEYTEGPGTRPVISNATAQMITRQDYSGNGNQR